MMKLALLFCMLVVGGHSQQPNTTVCCECAYEQGWSVQVNGTMPSGSNPTVECLRSVCDVYEWNLDNRTDGQCIGTHLLGCFPECPQGFVTNGGCGSSNCYNNGVTCYALVYLTGGRSVPCS